MSISVTTQPASISLSKNPIYYELAVTDGSGDPYTLANQPAGYYVEVEFSTEDVFGNGQYTALTTLQVLPDSDSNINLWLQGIVDNALRERFDDPPVPAYQTNTATLADTILRWKIRVREVISETPGSWTEPSARVSIYGGIPENIYTAFELIDALDASNSLLSYRPTRRRVDYNTPEYLHWYNYTGGVATIRLSITTYDTDGNSASSSFLTPSVPTDRTVVLPTGPAQLSLGASVREYTITVELNSDGTDLSQAITYEIESNTQEQVIYLHYLNTWGVTETLRCFGRRSFGLDVERQPAVQMLLSSTLGHQETYQGRFQSTDIINVRTGLMSEQEVETLREMLLYNEVYQVESSKTTRMYLRTDSVTLYEENQDQYFLAFEMQPAIDDTVYGRTDRLLQPIS